MLGNDFDFDVTPKEAVTIQRNLAARARIEPLAIRPATIGGVDVSIRQGWAQAAVVVLDANSLTLQEQAVWREPVGFPYISGLLSFREIPPLLRALDQLTALPDLIICDGQGIAHPRRLGLASHLGVVLDLPTIGAAKSRLIGEAEEPALEAGSTSLLRHKDEIIGALLRSRTGVKPLYISPGHRVTLDDALTIVQSCVTRYRMPEPTRLAHHLSRTDASEAQP